MMLAAVLLLASCGPLPEEQSGVCDAHRHAAALVTPYLVVYGSRTASPTTTAYYACLRPAGTRLEIGTDELGALYGSDATTGGFSAAGAYVAAQSSTGRASLEMCARYSNPRLCSRAQYWLTVVDTKTRRRAHLPIYSSLPVPALVPFPVTLALSPKGAVAWLQNITVGANVSSSLRLWATSLAPSGRSSLAAAPVMVDAGLIAPSSVRFYGRTLYWLRDHRSHHLEVR